MDILIVVKVDLLYLDDEEIPLYAVLIERDVALNRLHFYCLVGDCDAHGVDGWDEVEVEMLSGALEVFFGEDVVDL